MKAAVLNGSGALRVEDAEIPRITEDELLVRLRAASICGTDLRILAHGHFKLPAGRRRVLGHELIGEVVQAGDRVETFAAGDRVTVAPNVGCGHCRMCRDGFNQMCPDYEAFGVTIDGGFQEYLRVPAVAIERGNVFAIPAHVSDADAALVEPFSCCLSGQRKLRVGPEDAVVIIGAGPIGAFHTILARIAGARTVIVSGHGRERLERVRELGADAVVEVPGESLAEVVADLTDGRGADVAIVAVSSPAAQAEAVELLAPHGRLNFFSGLGDRRTVEIDSNRVHYQGLVLTGTTGSSNGDYTRSLELVASGRARLAQLVTATFPLERIDAALDHARSRAGMKSMIVFGGTP